MSRHIFPSTTPLPARWTPMLQERMHCLGGCAYIQSKCTHISRKCTHIFRKCTHISGICAYIFPICAGVLRQWAWPTGCDDEGARIFSDPCAETGNAGGGGGCRVLQRAALKRVVRVVRVVDVVGVTTAGMGKRCPNPGPM